MQSHGLLCKMCVAEVFISARRDDPDEGHEKCSQNPRPFKDGTKRCNISGFRPLFGFCLVLLVRGVIHFWWVRFERDVKRLVGRDKGHSGGSI